ncbi:MAG: 30S ribosome-binding factor RbfA [Chloroflexota bacterium]|nr:30S ribosome-binding factor RbfA [Chloroflexota bacterium]
MTQRTDRIDELLRQEIGQILAREVADPRIGFVTVTDVETDPDLRHARLWVSVIGQPAERDATMAALNRAMSFVRRELGTRLRLRRIPEFQVRLDDTAERGTRLLQLLHEIEEGNLPADAAAPGESLPTPVPRLPHPGDSPDPEIHAPGLPVGKPVRRRNPGRDGRSPGNSRGTGRGPGARRPRR